MPSRSLPACLLLFSSPLALCVPLRSRFFSLLLPTSTLWITAISFKRARAKCYFMLLLYPPGISCRAGKQAGRQGQVGRRGGLWIARVLTHASIYIIFRQIRIVASEIVAS